ncbi:hypothetical protein [Chlorobium sp. N1]|uniref:hypothetical protein n=1 Tax=Chlorobium sp. N1 TaxID=2491138 RepID=UPI00103F1272|nr:hypothetical protein [Chlorobium sp. N1]TCD46864.1 hypothetical protein E0L29_11075 [Chlorobium sp. N1]
MKYIRRALYSAVIAVFLGLVVYHYQPIRYQASFVIRTGEVAGGYPIPAGYIYKIISMPSFLSGVIERAGYEGRISVRDLWTKYSLRVEPLGGDGVYVTLKGTQGKAVKDLTSGIASEAICLANTQYEESVHSYDKWLPTANNYQFRITDSGGAIMHRPKVYGDPGYLYEVKIFNGLFQAIILVFVVIYAMFLFSDIIFGFFRKGGSGWRLLNNG